MLKAKIDGRKFEDDFEIISLDMPPEVLEIDLPPIKTKETEEKNG
jgi:hypothetical protein